jgi:hypothetical protein
MQQRVEEPAYAQNCSQSILASDISEIFRPERPLYCLAGSSQSELKRTLKQPDRMPPLTHASGKYRPFQGSFGAHGERSVSNTQADMVSKSSTSVGARLKSTDSRSHTRSIENLRQTKRFDFYAN